MEIAIVPSFIINRLTHNDMQRIHLNILLSSVLILLFFIHTGHSIGFLNELPHFCLFQKIFGIPCPGCGITRSLIAISELDIATSWQYNPAGCFISLFIIIQIPLRFIAMTFKNIEIIICSFSKYNGNCVVISLLLIWIARVSLQIIT